MQMQYKNRDPSDRMIRIKSSTAFGLKCLSTKMEKVLDWEQHKCCSVSGYEGEESN